jgi:hypothetical protein
MVRNSGQTPAYEVEVAAKIQIVTVPPETDITDSAPVVLSGDMAIVPNGHRHVAIALNDMIVSPEFDDVFNEKRWIIMFGCVKYIDAFGEKQKSRFCHLYQGMTLSAELVRYHHLGNGAT